MTSVLDKIEIMNHYLQVRVLTMSHVYVKRDLETEGIVGPRVCQSFSSFVSWAERIAG